MLDVSLPFGAIANETGRPLAAVVAENVDTAFRMASASFSARRSRLGQVVDVLDHRVGVELAGVIDNPPPLPLPEGTEPIAIAFAASTVIGKPSVFGSAWNLSIQRLSNLSPVTLMRGIAAMGSHASDAIEESLVDDLEALSLGSAQTATTIQEAHSEFDALATPQGGIAPALGGVIASQSLRGRAADERWDAWGVPIIFLRGITAGRFYLVPAVESGALVLPIQDGLMTRRVDNHKNAATLRLVVAGMASPTPDIKSSYLVRGTLS